MSTNENSMGPAEMDPNNAKVFHLSLGLLVISDQPVNHKCAIALLDSL